MKPKILIFRNNNINKLRTIMQLNLINVPPRYSQIWQIHEHQHEEINVNYSCHMISYLIWKLQKFLRLLDLSIWRKKMNSFPLSPIFEIQTKYKSIFPNISVRKIRVIYQNNQKNTYKLLMVNIFFGIFKCCHHSEVIQMHHH